MHTSRFADCDPRNATQRPCLIRTLPQDLNMKLWYTSLFQTQKVPQSSLQPKPVILKLTASNCANSWRTSWVCTSLRALASSNCPLAPASPAAQASRLYPATDPCSPHSSACFWNLASCFSMALIVFLRAACYHTQLCHNVMVCLLRCVPSQSTRSTVCRHHQQETPRMLVWCMHVMVCWWATPDVDGWRLDSKVSLGLTDQHSTVPVQLTNQVYNAHVSARI